MITELYFPDLHTPVGRDLQFLVRGGVVASIEYSFGVELTATAMVDRLAWLESHRKQWPVTTNSTKEI